MTRPLTIFSIPKPWTGLSAIAQDNALSSWTCLPNVQVVLFGDEVGVAEAAVRFGAHHIRDVARTQWGTPLVHEAFATVQRLSAGRQVCYANTDIVFFDDLLAAIQSVRLDRFLMTGARSELRLAERVDFRVAATRALVRTRAEKEATTASVWHLDYFVFPSEIPWELPPFAVGRAGWDGWLIHRARQLKIPIIDASNAVLALHQEHGYEHVPAGTGRDWIGPESAYNLALAGEQWLLGTLLDATHLLKDEQLQRAKGARYVRGRILRLAAQRTWVQRSVASLRPAYRKIKRLRAPRDRRHQA